MNPNKKNLINLLNLCFGLLFFLNSQAQLVSKQRIEIVSSDNVFEEHIVLNYNKNGFVIINPQMDVYGKKNTVGVSKYDTTLQLTWSKNFEINSNYRFIKYYKSDIYIYLLFRKDEKNDIQINRIDLSNGDVNVTETKLLTFMKVDFFKSFKNKILIGGKYNDKPVIELINLFDKNSKVLPGVYSNNQLLNNIEVDENSMLAYVAIQSKRDCKYLVNVFDYDGKFQFTENLNQNKLSPLNSKLLKIDSTDTILLGNYTDNCSLFSSGFFTYSFSDTSKTKFYSFDALKNYYNYLPEKRADKLKSKINNKKEKGKNSSIRNRILLHEIIQSNDGFYIIGEVFFPSYNPNRTTSYTSQNEFNSNKYFNKEFNNYKYSHAIICKFDKNGGLLWDYSIELKNIETYFLDEKVQVLKEGADIVIAYPKDNKIISEIISDSNKTKKEEFLISANNQNVIETFQSELCSWFDHKFLSYGYQKIKPLANDEASKEIFFLEIISYKTPNSN